METGPIPQSGTYNQDDATGFIRLNALRLKVAAKVQGKKSETSCQRTVILCCYEAINRILFDGSHL